MVQNLLFDLIRVEHNRHLTICILFAYEFHGSNSYQCAISDTANSSYISQWAEELSGLIWTGCVALGAKDMKL